MHRLVDCFRLLHFLLQVCYLFLLCLGLLDHDLLGVLQVLDAGLELLDVDYEHFVLPPDVVVLSAQTLQNLIYVLGLSLGIGSLTAFFSFFSR